MSRLTHSVRIGRYTIPALLLLALTIGSIAAVAYVLLSSTLTATVVANPKVCFIKWSDGSKKNAFNYEFNIFSSIKTIDENITYGIWNWNGEAHDIYLRVSSITNQAQNIASFNVKVVTSTGTLVAEITTFGTAWDGPYSIPAGAKYTIWIEVTATASPSDTSVFTVDMKVENP